MGLNKVQESNKNKTGEPFNFKCCAIYDGTINGAYDGSNDKVSGTTGTSQVAAIDGNKNDRVQISLKFLFL